MEAPASLVSVITRATTEGRNGLGAVVVFAAGNDNREIISGEMCDLPNVICASAINTYGQPTNYTNMVPLLILPLHQLPSPLLPIMN